MNNVNVLRKSSDTYDALAQCNVIIGLFSSVIYESIISHKMVVTGNFFNVNESVDFGRIGICQTVTEYARQAALQHMNPDLAKLNWGLQVTDCWGAIYEESDYTIAHSHFPSDFSGVVYLEAEENCAPIVFANKLVVQPKPRMLVMFPGLLLHSVPKTQGRRVVLVMNMHKFPSFPAAGPAPEADPTKAEAQSASVAHAV